MPRISGEQAAAMFEEIIGWPYVTPGTCDERGIDCSGAWVRVYRAFGLKIDHGSNSQFRRFCSRTGTIGSPRSLSVGMAVFKRRDWTDDQKGHRDYGSVPGDLYHVGCVTRIDPLRIVHATPDFAKADNSLGKWAYWGVLKEVQCGDVEQEALSPAPAQPVATQPMAGQAKVITTTSSLNLRAHPSSRGAIIKSLPTGTIVSVLEEDGAWARVRWDVKPGLWHIGWCCKGENGIEYLQFG